MFGYVKKLASNIFIVSDPQTQMRCFAKIDITDQELQALHTVSVLELPDHVKDTVYIPILRSDLAHDLPIEIQKTLTQHKKIAVLEAAKGENLKLYKFSLDGKLSSDLSISHEDWQKFKDTIRFLNAQGVVHGDLKNSENIFVQIEDSGHVKFEIIDWGGPDVGKPPSDEKDLINLEESLRSIGVLKDSGITLDGQSPTIHPNKHWMP